MISIENCPFFIQKINKISKMDNSQNNTSTLPDKNDHNSFAKIIKNFFHDDFILSNCWYERINEDSEAGGSEAEG